MSRWTPERYRELARECRIQAEHSLPPGRDFVLAMADEYEAKAAGLYVSSYVMRDERDARGGEWLLGPEGAGLAPRRVERRGPGRPFAPRT